MTSADKYFLADFRILGAVRVNDGQPDLDYLSQRNRLAQRSWEVVDAARKHGFYCDVITFPGWKDSDDMLDFGWMHRHYELNGFETFCFRLNGSPIADSVELTEEKMSGGELPNLDTLRRLAPLTMLRRIGSTNLQKEVFSDERFKTAYQQSPFVRCLEGIFSTPHVHSGFLLCSEAFGNGEVQKLDVEHAILLFWLVAWLYPVEEFAVEIVEKCSCECDINN